MTSTVEVSMSQISDKCIVKTAANQWVAYSFAQDVESMAIRNVYAWRNSSIIYSARRVYRKPLQSSRLFKMHSAGWNGATDLRNRYSDGDLE